MILTEHCSSAPLLSNPAIKRASRSFLTLLPGAPGGIRTPNLLIQSQMLPESYHLLESYRGQGVSERRSASGRAEARARASLVSRVFFAFPISVQPPRDD